MWETTLAIAVAAIPIIGLAQTGLLVKINGELAAMRVNQEHHGERLSKLERKVDHVQLAQEARG